jgi:hypothetical protein
VPHVTVSVVWMDAATIFLRANTFSQGSWYNDSLTVARHVLLGMPA